jgi:hypothetical protein
MIRVNCFGAGSIPCKLLGFSISENLKSIMFGQKGCTMRIIHDGHGATRQCDEAPFVDYTEVLPLQPQRLKLKRRSKNTHVPKVRAHTNYRKGFIYELGDDQCRFIFADSSKCCGAVIQNGRTVMQVKPYCDAHCKIV